MCNKEFGVLPADLCTRQLGYRTELDGAEAERREVTEKRLHVDRPQARERRAGIQPGRRIAYFTSREFDTGRT